MEMPVNRFKRAIQPGQKQIGLWSGLGSATALEIIAGAGYDWIVLDTEHSPSELPDVLSGLRALGDGNTSAVVRPAWNDIVLIKRFLDMGFGFVAVGSDIGVLRRASEGLLRTFK